MEKERFRCKITEHGWITLVKTEVMSITKEYTKNLKWHLRRETVYY